MSHEPSAGWRFSRATVTGAGDQLGQKSALPVHRVEMIGAAGR